MTESVILVDEHDNETGIEEKLKAHQSGKMHRAFSVFIFNPQGQLLLQRRAVTKYHCGGMWSNTCCSHPRPGETIEEAAHRRLKEEMGFDCGLREVFSVQYKALVSDGLIENEYDHVLIGEFYSKIEPEAGEVCDWKFISLRELSEDIRKAPEKYTYWLKLILPKISSYMEGKQ